MNAWLVINGLVNSKKFRELYGFLSRAEEKRGISLTVRTSDSLVSGKCAYIQFTEIPF